MSRRHSRIALAATVLAATAMAASPAMARGWGGWGGWGGHRHHHRGVDAGDVIAGLLIVGTVAAVASAASKSDSRRRATREGDYREPYRRDDSPRYGEDRREDSRASRGIGAAIETCADEVERDDRRVEDIGSVTRDGEGWRITGRLGQNSEFACSVSDSGRIRSVTVDGRAA